MLHYTVFARLRLSARCINTIVIELAGRTLKPQAEFEETVMTQRLRIGLIGAGGNTRSRHIPGLLAQEDVDIVAVCNRRPESTAAVARELRIERTYAHWQELVADPEIDAIVIGTWPYLHCPITIAALAA